MLQILRKKAQSTFIQIIVVIIALVFIFWGVGANLSGDRQAALVVNGEEITFQEFQQAYDRAYQRLSDQFGGNVPKGLAETFGVKQQVINQLIQTTLLRQGAEKMGLLVSGQEIREIIEDMVQFQENGAFNLDRYKAVLASNRMAPTKFEASMRFDRLSEVAAREIGNFAVVATDFEIQELYSEQNEKVAVTFLKISPDQFIDKVTTDDEALKAWFETVKENYKSEPEIKLKYLAFTYENIGQKIPIDQSKIEEYYQNNIDAYQIPEERHARHILFKAGETDSAERHEEQAQKAEEILALARKGGDFDALAREYSEGPSKDSGGDLGFFSAGRMVPAFDEAVFVMQPGDISDVVKTQFGYHIILLEEIQPAATRALEEVTAEITATLQQKEAESLAFQVANDAYEGIIGAGSLTKYAETNPDTVIQQTGFFPRSDAPDDLLADAQFMEKAFELNKGELSSLIKGQSGYAILFAEDIKEPEIPAFEAIKDTLAEDYQKAQSKKMAEEAAEQMLSDLRDGKELAVLAQELGVPVEESGFLSQNEQNDTTTFPPALLSDAFMLSASSPLPEEPGKVGDDFFIFSFLDREIPTMPETSEEAEKYRENLLQFKQQQLLSAWLRNLEQDAEITRHQSL
ncbi:MAG: SurA N-terminal domain-containing protein [Desulforhopalus sp.]